MCRRTLPSGAMSQCWRLASIPRQKEVSISCEFRSKETSLTRASPDIKEAFTMGDCAIEPEQDYVGKTGHNPPSHITRPQNIWPSKAPWWREGMYKYYNSILPLTMKLVKIFALAFDLEETAFDDIFKFPITGMRPLYYPPMPVDDESPNIGLGAHSDFSCTSWSRICRLDSHTMATKGKKEEEQKRAD